MTSLVCPNHMWHVSGAVNCPIYFCDPMTLWPLDLLSPAPSACPVHHWGSTSQWCPQTVQWRTLCLTWNLVGYILGLTGLILKSDRHPVSEITSDFTCDPCPLSVVTVYSLLTCSISPVWGHRSLHRWPMFSFWGQRSLYRWSTFPLWGQRSFHTWLMSFLWDYTTPISPLPCTLTLSLSHS